MSGSEPYERIWLQWVGSDKQDIPPEDRKNPARAPEVTWCQDKIYDTDIEYVMVKR